MALLSFSKSRMEQSLRERFFGSSVFPIARTAYQFCFNRSKLENRRRMRSFYSQFVKQGELVFDAGANVGVYSEIFTDLGAKVVAIEPNPDCCRLLERLANRRSVTVESCAVGETFDRIVLRLSDNSELSSANPDWCAKVQRSSLHWNAHWVGEIEVEVTTLDRLAERHGIPSFVKIDVEGFDDRVMRGMSFKPNVLTFEFNRLLPEVAGRCLEAPVISSGYEFNFVHGGKLHCASSDWLDRCKFTERLDALAADDPSGDVIARRIGRA
jgi:FkbM family methyltransferase